jgi:adenylylsulfate kinase-like enzyme
MKTTVTRARREAQNGHRGAILWFTGLSGAGKSTLAHAVEEALHQRGCRTALGDRVTSVVDRWCSAGLSKVSEPVFNI